MIRHIIFFSVKPGTDVETVREGLMNLGRIPHSSHFEVTLNRKLDLYENEVDIVVYAEFENEAALHAYKADPIYGQTTANVRPMREMRFSADVIAADK
ncbi:Dabb family protein [Aquamicrobium segne]|uniref:Dabb family protein n=1 Tax=Aquamicrobium segne TaxID=469547 RepID=A0ABW0GY50_9HYPH